MLGGAKTKVSEPGVRCSCLGATLKWNDKLSPGSGPEPANKLRLGNDEKAVRTHPRDPPGEGGGETKTQTRFKYNGKVRVPKKTRAGISGLHASNTCI